VVLTPDNAELVRVIDITDDTLTIARMQEGSSARAILIGDLIFAAITAKTITDIEDAGSPASVPQGGKVIAMHAGTDVTLDPAFPNTRDVEEGDYALSVLGRDSSGVIVNVKFVKTPATITLKPDFDNTIVDWTATLRTQ
jgi:hypothetical protein